MTSFRRKPESRKNKHFWTPAFAGVTALMTFYEAVKLDEFVKSRKSPFSVIPSNPGSGPGQAPESSLFIDLQNTWTPVTLSRRKPGTGVTTFYEAIKLGTAC